MVARGLGFDSGLGGLSNSGFWGFLAVVVLGLDIGVVYGWLYIKTLHTCQQNRDIVL
jgi:hypothetical protein